MNNASPLLIFATLISAMALRILPWPETLAVYNPDWVLLITLFWCLATPDRFGVTAAWFVGLLTDALTGKLLGQHALTYALVAYLAHRLYRRIRMAPISQESFFILLLLLFSQLALIFIENFIGPNEANWDYWLPSLVGALVWPLIRWIMSLFNSNRRRTY